MTHLYLVRKNQNLCVNKQVIAVGCRWVKIQFFSMVGLWCVTENKFDVSVQDYDSHEKFTIRDDRISHLLPTSYQDMIVRVYSKKPELVCQIKHYHSLITGFIFSLTVFD